MCHLETNGFIMMISYGVLQESTQDSLIMLSMTCRMLLYMGWCVIKIQYYRFGLHGYICYELVFDAKSAVSYVYSGLHGIEIIS
jgi:hypothetical protein